MSISGGTLEAAQAVTALGLIALALWCLPRAFARVWRVWTPADAKSWGLAVSVLTAAVLRFAVPHLLATIFIGYKLTEQAIALFPVSHYGIGASALYHALFAVFPMDHATIMWANAVMGTLTVPLVATWAARLYDDRVVGVVVGFLLAATVLFIRNDASEANNVPCLLWLFSGLVLWQEHLETGRRLPLLAALPLLALCCVSRPEMPALAVLAVGVTLVAHGRQHLQWKWALAGLATVGLLTLPHVLHLANAVGTLKAEDSLPGFSLDEISLLPGWFISRNVLLRPEYFPMAVTVFAAVALVVRGRRPRLVDWAMFGLAAFAVLVYVVDLDEANIARVHVPAALFATVLGAAGLVRLNSWVLSRRRTDRERHPRVFESSLITALVLGALGIAPTHSALYAPTNEAMEETLIRETEAALPADAPYTLVRPHIADQRRRGKTSRLTHFHFPDYLFRPPVRDGVLRSLSSFLGSPGDLEEPTYYLQGMRCFAEFRLRGTPAPKGDDMHPSCAAMHERFVLEPVFERDVPNRGDVWIEYYGDAETLKVGLYRVTSATP